MYTTNLESNNLFRLAYRQRLWRIAYRREAKHMPGKIQRALQRAIREARRG